MKKTEIILIIFLILCGIVGIKLSHAQSVQDQIDALNARINKDTVEWQQDNALKQSWYQNIHTIDQDINAMNQEIYISQSSRDGLEASINNAVDNSTNTDTSTDTSSDTNVDNSLDEQGTVNQIGS